MIWLVLRGWNLREVLTEELEYRGVVGAFCEYFSSAAEGGDNPQRDSDTYIDQHLPVMMREGLTGTREGVAQLSIRILEPFSSGPVRRDERFDGVTPATSLCTKVRCQSSGTFSKLGCVCNLPS